MENFDHQHHEETAYLEVEEEPSSPQQSYVHQEDQHQQEQQLEQPELKQTEQAHQVHQDETNHDLTHSSEEQFKSLEMAPQEQSSNQQNSGEACSRQRRVTIVDRVNQIPIVNMAVNVSHDRYDQLKQSNVTVGEVMSRAEQWAYCLWGSVQPIVSKFQEPLGKADQLACQTLDYVEEKVPSIKKSPAQLTNEAISMKTKYAQVVEQSTIAKFLKMIAESFLRTMHSISSPTASQPTTTQ